MEPKQALKILTDLISIETVDQNESQVADYLTHLFVPFADRAQLKRISFAPGRDNLLITVGTQGPILGFSGHEDVVAADKDQWQTDPFVGTMRDDRIYGRGASDMKSGLAAMVVAMLDLLASNQPLPGRIRLLATIGEETGEYGANQVVQQGLVDDLAGIVIGEPSNLQLEVTHKGVIDYCVTSVGLASHASKPEAGQNAIWPLILFAQKVHDYFEQATISDPKLGQMTHVLSQINGGEQINSVPAKAQLTGNIRTIPAYSHKQIYQFLDNAIEQINQADDAQLTIEYRYPEPPLPDQSHNKLVLVAQGVLQNKLHLPGEIIAGTGATEACEYVKVPNMPILVCGPGEGISDHQDNEWVSIKNYLLGCQFYEELAWQFWKDQLAK
ncbi:ArgE/DapE family deacylase [Bombilactobacillus thymidiniphilus]|uniref:Probable succinyl-diaminopimelate desuccinylase n=1 Tax=Bombilactobacillus thymidiniphilus TaxID=2923363 RepID=A0ABY4PCS6_9LACO|nr:ArgE/DapE family deacylase [Bombilactobacillus thymidiniphilus]UQS83501.1 ArgE/DapE family deacylase [Bombilactobacillus thymidiniphilus]